MRIGILRADSVLEQFVPRHGDYPAMFRSLLACPAARPAGLATLQFTDIDALGGRFPAPDACDAYVITGSRHSVYDDLPWIRPLADFVAAALARRRRVLGICFGHQLLAHFFGGETRAAEGGWCVGVHEAEIVSREPWMEPAAERIRLLSSHRDQVVRLPSGARPFARGGRCPHAGFVMDGAMTLQGHPEFTRDYAAALMHMRQAQLGAEVYGAGMGSLEQPPDAVLAARWMLNFASGAGS